MNKNNSEIITKINKPNNDNILIDLIKNQRKNIPVERKLQYSDLKRISKYLSNSIFSDDCSHWNGYITVIKNDEKNSYINFYYCRKKYALHRLLYINFIGDLADSEYIKFKCLNKGKCCNIKHFYKINNSDHSEHASETNSETNSEKNNTASIVPNKFISPIIKPKDSHTNIVVDFNL
jgi:hypothetical protein